MYRLSLFHPNEFIADAKAAARGSSPSGQNDEAAERTALVPCDVFRLQPFFRRYRYLLSRKFR